MRRRVGLILTWVVRFMVTREEIEGLIRARVQEEVYYRGKSAPRTLRGISSGLHERHSAARFNAQ